MTYQILQIEDPIISQRTCIKTLHPKREEIKIQKRKIFLKRRTRTRDLMISIIATVSKIYLSPTRETKDKFRRRRRISEQKEKILCLTNRRSVRSHSLSMSQESQEKSKTWIFRAISPNLGRSKNAIFPRDRLVRVQASVTSS